MLDERSQRPGELADLVAVSLEANLRDRLESLAGRCRLPLALFAVIAVEADRALREVAASVAMSAADLATLLDAGTDSAPEPVFDPRPTRALRDYARALRSSAYKQTRRRGLTLVVPDRLRARWALAAQGDGMALEAWIVERLAAAAPGRERWEAQAAFDGRTLAEWIALQALRRSRRSSTSAQPTA